ncbi:MAG: calcium-binding protein [Cypionkella sp.]
MAIFRILTTETFNSYYDVVGGTLIRDTSKHFSYVSTAGFTVEVTGIAIYYGATGIPRTGTITSMTVRNGTSEYASNTELKIAAVDFVKFALGLVNGSHTVLEPDAEALQMAMRSGSDLIYNSDFGRNLSGYGGDDVIFGGSGDDWFYGGTGHDSFYGGDGIDGVTFEGRGLRIVPVLYRGLSVTDDGHGNSDYALQSIEKIEATDDAIFGDSITLGSQYDTNGMEIWLRGGNDTLYGGSAYDTIYGGDGNDIITAGGYVDGGRGVDQVSIWAGGTVAFWSAGYGGHAADVNLSLATAQVRDDGFGNIESIQNATQLAGSMFDDRFTGSAKNDVLWGNDGNDSLSGANGDDELYGNSGNDSLYGGNGNDLINGGSGHDLMKGGAGIDELSLWTSGTAGHGVKVDLGLSGGRVLDDGFGNKEVALGFENLSGSDLADNLTGNGLANVIWGNDGNDSIFGGAGYDVLSGGAGRDSLIGGLGNDSLWGYDGADTLGGGLGADHFYFSDALPASTGVDTLIDMTHAIDKIDLPLAWSTAFQGTSLTAAQFLNVSGAPVAKTASQIVLYNKTTGNLFFDADGSGSAFTTVFLAHLDNHATLTWQDFEFYG